MTAALEVGDLDVVVDDTHPVDRVVTPVAICWAVTVMEIRSTDSDSPPRGQVFDQVLYDVDTRAFGAESDMDQNGLVFVIFSSSRRRHTRFDCDWSSDVCSSD